MGDTSGASFFSEIEAKLSSFQTLKYAAVSGLALLYYDCILTLGDEVTYIGPSRMNIPKVLYFLNRYSGLLDATLVSYLLTFGGDHSFCAVSLQVFSYAACYGIVIAEAILMLRTWAVWGRMRLITVIFSLLLIIDLFAPALIIKLYLNSMEVVEIPGITSCIYLFPSRLLYIDFILIIITESISLGLLLKKSFSGVRCSALKVLYEDGILYFVVILCVSLANLIVVLVSPNELALIFIPIQRVLHSCCCTRILLNIRSSFKPDGTPSGLGFIESKRYVVLPPTLGSGA